MKPSYVFFVVVLILGSIGGYYFHEALNEKINYERDSCYLLMEKHLAFTNPETSHDLILNETEHKNLFGEKNE